MLLFLLLVYILLLLLSIALIPLWTDAPLYHFPGATIGLLVANVVIFMLTGGDLESPLVLMLGDGITPLQWLTSIYMHDGLMHLLGNMLFLWVFGLVVEGKIGALIFLGIYHAIGIIQMGVTQLLCLGIAEPIPTLGASGAIFGLMAIAMIWAPNNNIICPISLATGADVSLMMFSFYFLALNFIVAWLSEFGLSSELMHLIGAVLGAAIGVYMFKKGLVDCEGYDLFAVVSGREGEKGRQPKPFKSRAKHDKEQNEKLLAEQRHVAAIREGQARFQNYLDNGHVDMATAKFAALRKLDPTLQPTQSQLLSMISLFLKQQSWDKAIPEMEQYLTRFDSTDPSMRLKLARVLLVAKQRPRAALKAIQPLEPERLSSKAQEVYSQIRALAQQQISQGNMELGD